ncbi:TonB-dependent receptor [Alteromonas sp. KUL49]|uniref:TonB-dependent receptor n=1 Tax=Alteromonas sp. KUL49 TaxID=2480798 RepID=UPI00102EFBB4|nr:TonB-dependent receptor [Alteromonas sp. KUL49]TAP34290.1 TonB-dependent receptor [Alteromonas sp. KUL49]GEA13600.1 TonB-dependent receptor [Alteromonas sp. KUL49]
MFKQNKLATLVRSHLLTSLMVSAVAFPFAVHAQEANTQQSQETAAEDEAEIIVVQGIRGSLSRSTMTKRAADQIVDAISAEDIGKLPDNNIAEALQRVTGLQIGRDEGGEGAGFQVRGLSQNRVEINGRSLISNNSDNRNNSFNGISSALFAGVEVIKSPSASDTEGALGATVRLKTRKPFSTKPGTIQVAGKVSHDDLRGDEYDPEINLFASDVFETSAGDLGVLINISAQDYHQRTDQFQNNGWSKLGGNRYNLANAQHIPEGELTNPGNPGYDVWVARTNRFQRMDFDRQRIGIDSSIQWQASENLELFSDITLVKFETQQNQPKVVTQLHQGNIRFGFSPEDLITVTDQDDVQHGFLMRGTAVSATNANNPNFGQGGWIKYNPTHNLTEEEQYAVAFGGQYLEDDWSVKAQYQTSRAVNDTKGINTNFQLTKANEVLQRVEFDFFGSDLPQVNNILPEGFSALETEGFEMRNVWSRNQDRETGEDSFKLDFEFMYELGPIYALKTGYRYSNRIANRNQFQLNDPSDGNESFTVLIDELPDNVRQFITLLEDPFMEGVSGTVPRQWFTLSEMTNGEFVEVANAMFALDDPEGFEGPAAEFLENFGNFFDIEEKTHAIYAQADFEGDFYRGNFGVRYVQTDAAIDAYNILSNGPNDAFDPAFAELVSAANDYSKFLPSANISFDLSEDMQLRFAAAKVMSRPNPADLSPALNLPGNSQQANVGNPNLAPFEATQFDVSYEWYMSQTSALSAAIFYKDVASFFKEGTRNEIIDISEDRNSDGCTVATIGIAPDCTAEIAQDDEVVISFKENGESGTIRGFELSWQQDLGDFFDSTLDGFGFVLNYTYTDSDQPEQNFNQVTGEELPLPQLSEVSYNAIVFYEKNGLGIRLAYNYRDESLIANSQQGLARYADEYDQLDISADYQLSEDTTLFFSGTNITNSPVHEYVGISQATYTYRETGARYTAGIRTRF